MKKESKKSAKKSNYFKEVKKEMSKVKWPERKDVVKYTVATIVLVIIIVCFFILLTMGMSGLFRLFGKA
ncbi:MAG: preprotein translocase subunit SecE [Bacilli bacterium]|nr:preprotein translocase subunit SecE [Bacilli bacterium]